MFKRALLVSLAFLLFGAACERKPTATTGASGAGAPREDTLVVMESPGYIPTAQGVLQGWLTGGIAAPGDINGDRHTDFMIASGTHPGQIAAYSGADGKPIWQLQPLVGRAKEEASFSLEDFVLIHDHNGDGIADVFAPNASGRKQGIILSGKDGARLLRLEMGYMQLPVRSQDLNADGVPDLLFLRGHNGLQAFSGKDLSAIEGTKTLAPVDDPNAHGKLLLPSLPDLNADGIPELLAGAVMDGTPQWLFLNGKDFSVLRRLTVPYGLVLVPPQIVCIGDITGDGIPDFILSENRGASKDKDLSCLAAISGADASILWETPGDVLPAAGGRFAVDAKTRARRELPGDIGFGGATVAVSDVDGDGIREIASAVTTSIDGNRVQAVALFSGKTGRHVATLALDRRHGHLDGKQLLFVESAGPQARPAVAVTGRKDDRTSIVAVLELPNMNQ